MVVDAVGIKPTRLQDQNGNKIELVDMLYIPNFKKKIISLLKLLVIGILGAVMEELQPRILVRPDGTIAGVRCWNIRTRELERELTILESN